MGVGKKLFRLDSEKVYFCESALYFKVIDDNIYP